MNPHQLGINRPHDLTTDLRLINTYLKDQFQLQLKPTKLSHLNSILKSRVGQRKSKEQKQKCRDWLALHKVNMEPLIQYVKDQRKRKDEMKMRVNDYANKVVQPTLLQQEEYFHKVIDHSMNNYLHFTASTHSQRDRFLSCLMKRLNVGELGRRGEQFKESNLVRVSRSSLKRNKYMELTVNLIKRQQLAEGQFQIKEWSLMLCQNIQHNLWKLVHKQLANITADDVAAPFPVLHQKLLTNSLLALQQEYDQNLPHRTESISTHLESKYLSKMEPGQYILDSQLGCVWGKAFLLFRAGRTKQLSPLLKKHGLDQLDDQILRSDRQLKSYRPAKVEIEFNHLHQKDVFREQIMFALSGQRKYSSNAISDLNTLDSIWILLRNTGIFYKQEGQLFEQIKEQMVEYYKQNLDPSQIVYFLAYLLEYDSIIAQGPNRQIDQDDYLHLLILISKFPFMITKPNILALKITEALTSYALQLSRDQDSPYLQYYLSLIPLELILEEGPSIIVNYKLYPIIKWKILNQILQESLFMELLRRSTERYASETDKFLEGAEMLMDWVRQQTIPNIECICSAIDMILSMLIKNISLGRMFDKGQIEKGIYLAKYWSSGDVNLRRDYGSLLQLFQNNRKLQKHIVERDYSQINIFLQKLTEQNIFFSSIDYLKGKMFQKLAQLQGLDVFFIFLRNIVRVSDMLFTHQASSIGLSKDIRYEVLKMCKLVQEHERFSRMMPSKCLSELLTELQNEIASITNVLA